MRKFTKPFFSFLCCVLVTGNLLQAQKTTIEQIKEQCSGIDYNQRVRLSVSSFNVSTLSNPGRFGDELSQMLTNALQGVNCFNVLLSTKDSKELTDEIAFGQAGNTAAGSSPQTGKMKGAQVIVVGKVTEYSAGEKKFQALGIGGSGGNKAHVGFVIQLVNAETREIIDSKSINVDGKTSGFSGAQLFGVNIAGGSSNKSLQDACEKGIQQAVEFIASRRDQMPLPKGSSGTVTASASTGKSVTEINVMNADYSKLKVLTDVLTAKGKVLEKTMSEGKGFIRFEHAGSSDSIADFIDSKLAGKFSIQDLASGKITLAAK